MNYTHAFDLAAVLMVLAAFLGFINYRFLNLPHTLGLTIMGASLSLIAIGIDFSFPSLHLRGTLGGIIESLDFSDLLLDVMLSFLLFAGALHVDLGDLLEKKWLVGVMATLGTIISTILIGFGLWGLAKIFSFELHLIWCFVFGALISPTDPVAVMGVLKRAGVGKALEAKIAGESLFNDGVGVVIFSLILSIALASTGDVSAHHGGGAAPELTASYIFKTFSIEAIGGMVMGLFIGWIGYQGLKRVDEYNLEVIITLAVVMGGYTLAGALGLSGPVAMAVAGLLIGNHGVTYAMSEETRKHLLSFWSLIDEILNSILFMLIGLEFITLSFSFLAFGLGFASIILALTARTISTGLPLTIIRIFRPLEKGTIPLLIWGGLRGGISIALALSLPKNPETDILLTITYIVVIFSVLVQGSTVGLLAKKLTGRKD